MKKSLLLLALFAGGALAVQPSDVKIVKDPLTTVTIKRNKTNVGKTIQITLNPQDTISITNIPPVPPPMRMGLPVDLSSTPVVQPGINTVLLSEPGPIPEGPAPGDWEKDGKIRIVCNTAAYGFFDFIVYPNQPDTGHHHNYFGNTGVSAATNSDNIRLVGNASCRGGTFNKSSYWVPTMLDNLTHKIIPTKGNLLYYATGFGQYMNTGVLIQPFPKGLRMIAGNPNSVEPGSNPINYTCLMLAQGYGREGKNNLPYIPECVPGEDELWAFIKFPQCGMLGVDGKPVIDSPDHRSHMAYPVFNDGPTWTAQRQYKCPDSHPILYPEVTYHLQYLVPTAPGAMKNWAVSSDTYLLTPGNTKPGGYSLHGDWFDGWDHAVFDPWIIFCLRGQRNCGTAIMPDGRVTLEFQGN